MYLEAIQECEKTEKEHKISQEDIDLIGELKNDAQWRYNEYIKQEKENKRIRSKKQKNVKIIRIRK